MRVHYVCTTIAAAVLVALLYYNRKNENYKIFVDDRTIAHFHEKAFWRRQKIAGTASEFHNLLAEEALCPNLFRIGRVGDGGKWICGPQFVADWKTKCVIYSFGINGDASFETEIHNVTGGRCDMVAVDMKRWGRPARELNEIGAAYVETQIYNVTTFSTTTISDLMKIHNHTHIDILKMDIEGSEYVIADELFKLGICQMMVELHTRIEEYSKFIEWLKDAADAGYYLIHHEVNIKHMNCVEITLLHSKCFDRFGDIIQLTRFLNSV